MKDEEAGEIWIGLHHTAIEFVHCPKAFGYSMSLKKRAEIQFSD